MQNLPAALKAVQVKRALAILEKKKLIERKSIVTKDEKQLILKCLLAHVDNSVQNKSAPWPPHSPALQAALVDKQENSTNIDTSTDEENKSRPASRPTDFRKAAPHPVSDNKIRLDYAREFFELLAERGYYINHIHHKKTIAMIQTWIKAGVTLEDARIGMTHCDTQLGDKPSHPTYYQRPVLQYKHDLQSANQQAEEITNETTRVRASKVSAADEKRLSTSERMAKWREEKEREQLEEDGPGCH